MSDETMPTPNRPWVLILAGGRGTRFWPASRRLRPKHVLPLLGEEGQSLLQATIDRAGTITSNDRIFIITAEEQESVVVAACEGLEGENIIVEPEPRNTAPAIALGLVQLQLRGAGPDDPVIVMPSDAWVSSGEIFAQVMSRAVDAAFESESVVTLGVKPDRPETGYGYLGLGAGVDIEVHGSGGGREVREVRQFREKPNLALARDYLDSGQWWWNAGIFVFRLGYMARLMGDVNETLDVDESFRQAVQHGDMKALAAEYRKLPDISIDHGVMEQAPSVLTVEADFGWSDLGSWHALAPALEEGPVGSSRASLVLGEGATGNVVYAPGKTVALLGVEGLVVVATDDAVLVVPRERAQDVRLIVEKLAEAGEDGLL